MLYSLQLWQLIVDNHFFCLPADGAHRCQPSRFRQDSPKFDCYVLLQQTWTVQWRGLVMPYL